MSRIDPAELPALLAPCAVGAPLVAGWRLARARVDAQGRLVLTVAGPTADLVVSPRQEAPCYLQTRRFNLHVQTPDRGRVTSSELQQVLQRLAQVVQQNDAQPLPVVVQPPTAPAPTAGSVLWLVPGHLGEPDDLTVRALRILRLAGLIVVEPGKAALARQVLQQVGVERPAEAFVALGDDPEACTQLLTEAAVQQLDVALFGVDEGIPGFGDPGRTLVALASQSAEWQVRTVGGASALGMALLRLPEPLGDFQFVAIGDHQHARVRDWARQPERPMVFFATPRELRQLAESWRELPAVRATVMGRLTQPDEWLQHATMADGRLEGLAATDAEPTVVVLRQL